MAKLKAAVSSFASTSVKQSQLKQKRHRSQYGLESAILRRCSVGKDQLDKLCKFDGVRKLAVRPGDTRAKDFPQAWVRWEGSRQRQRGVAEWFVPKGADTRRRMLYLHGGTYVLYAPQDAVFRNLCSRLALACHICVLAIDYRLADEHLFPAAYDDSMAALQWIVSHGPGSAQECEQATDIFVCGDSAGGGLALAVCLGATATIRTVLRGCISLSGWHDLTASTPSYETRKWNAEKCFGDAVNPQTDRESSQEEAEGYLGEKGVALYGKDWRASPFFASADKLRRLPAVLMQVGDYELILDESVLLGKRMQKLGHPDVTVEVYPRMWHCWHQYSEGGGEKQTLQKAVTAVHEIGRWVKARFVQIDM